MYMFYFYVLTFSNVMTAYNCNCLHCTIIRVIHVGYYHFTKFCFLHLPVSGIVKCIARGCLLLFYKNYIVYYNDYRGVFIEMYVYTKFRLDCFLCE